MYLTRYTYMLITSCKCIHSSVQFDTMSYVWLCLPMLFLTCLGHTNNTNNTQYVNSMLVFS